MWTALGNFSQLNEFLGYKIPTFAGQSGSPILKREKGKEYVIGVHIGSNINGTRNIAIRMTPDKRKTINEWVKRKIG